MDMRSPPYAEFRFAFHARDFDASVRFYQEQLGFLQMGGWDRPDGRGALLNAAFGAVVEIYGAPGAGSKAKKAKQYDYGSINLAVRLESPAAVDEAHQRLKDAGAKLDGEPEDRAWGHRSFIVRDPDEIAVHIYAELARPPADPPGVQR
jgi:catechol 2,3-dioxygenase-like lactoylglutathione lyase family enzyme